MSLLSLFTAAPERIGNRIELTARQKGTLWTAIWRPNVCTFTLKRRTWADEKKVVLPCAFSKSAAVTDVLTGMQAEIDPAFWGVE